MTALLVLARIVISPLANVFQKRLTQRGADPLCLMAVTFSLIALLTLPFLFTLAFPQDPAFWRALLLTGVLDVAGNALLVAALQRTDLSLFGPINAYKAVISLGFAMALIGEIPSPASLAGVLLIVIGSLLLQGGTGPKESLIHHAGVRLRVVSLIVLSLAAVFLKQCILLSSPWITFALWPWAALPFALVAAYGRRAGQWERLSGDWRDTALAAGCFGAAQVCVLFTFRALPVGVALALFQTSTLLSVLLGHHFFQEGQLPRRLAASGVMLAGAVLTTL